jgi:hypothetical protein
MFFPVRALMERERQASEAAEEARREQSVLSCARRDSARAAAELKRRHLEAAVYLEGPGPGGAIHGTYEAVREEAVLRVSTGTQKEHDQMRREHGGGVRRSPEPLSPAEVAPFHVHAQPVMREACRAVESEVQHKLNQWREQLYSGGGSGGGGGSSDRYGPSPAAEPSLAPASSPLSTPPGSAGGGVKLLGSQKGGPHEGLRRPDSWPGIFSFQK